MTEAAAPPAPAAAPAAAPSATETGIVELVKILQRLQRPDLAQRATAAAARLKRPSTIVCVVGEFKQGKSSLVNGLLGQAICPVDDDLATSAITLVRYGEQAVGDRRAPARRTAPAVSEAVPIEQLGDWVSEAGNPRQREAASSGSRSPCRARCSSRASSSSTRRAWAASAPATPPRRWRSCPFADGLIFVSRRLRRAVGTGGRLPAPGDRAVPDGAVRADEDRPLPAVGAHRRAQPRPPRAPRRCACRWSRCRASLRAAALARKDRELNERSRFPVLVKELGDQVVAPAKAGAAARSADEARSIAAMVRTGLEAEKSALGDPSATKDALARAGGGEATPRAPARPGRPLVDDRRRPHRRPVERRHVRVPRRRCARSRATWTRWSRGCTKGDAWDDMVRDLQADVADEVANAFVALEDGRLAIRDEVVAHARRRGPRRRPRTGIAARRRSTSASCGRARRSTSASSRQEAGVRHGPHRHPRRPGRRDDVRDDGPVPAGRRRRAARHQPGAARHRRAVRRMGLAEDRKRKVQMRRQTARGQVRQFLDDVQFEVSNQLSSVVRDIQRELRDEFTDRLGELQRTYTDAAKRAQEDAQKGQGERAQRGGELDQSIAALRKVEAVLGVGVDERGAGRPAVDRGAVVDIATRLEQEVPAVADDRQGDPRAPRRARCTWRSPDASRPASRRCSTPSSASGSRRPTPASAPASCRGTARARATRSRAKLRDGRDQPLDVQARRRRARRPARQPHRARRALARRALAGVHARLGDADRHAGPRLAQRRELAPHPRVPRPRARAPAATPTP